MDSCWLLLPLGVLLATCARAQPASDEWLRPRYHYTRSAHHMNDPNGLMMTRDADGSAKYHMFYQSSDPGQSAGSIWGHAVSRDLVNWQRLPRTAIRGSSGGGVGLPTDFLPPSQLAGARAVTVSSVPMSPSLSPPTGLHLWYSTEANLSQWVEYRNASSVQSSTNATCVICPELIPDKYMPGYIGDNYLWLERSNDTDPTKRYTFYVLSGSTRCAEGHPWCSYQGIGGNSTGQAFVFASSDLLHWRLTSNWDFLPKQDAWPAGFAHDAPSQWPAQRVDTPDTFAVTDKDTGASAQAFVWLNSPGCNTHWMLGTMNQSNKLFSASTHIGCADKGSMFCQQSLTTADDERVSIGWIPVSGQGWDGAQSLPRVVTLDAAGISYSPLKAISNLHSDYHFWRDHLVKPGNKVQLEDISDFGAHMHAVLELKSIAAGSQFVFSVLGGACEVAIELVQHKQQCTQTEILNNTDTHGSAGKLAQSVPANKSITPEWCRQICCNDPSCAGWTFADPQPGSSGSKFDCWVREAGVTTFASDCGDGHCWSGLVGQGHWQVSVAGSTLGSVRASNAIVASPVDIFVDGSIVEVYFQGEVITKLFEKATTQNVTMHATGTSDLLLHLDAWRMNSSIVNSE